MYGALNGRQPAEQKGTRCRCKTVEQIRNSRDRFRDANPLPDADYERRFAGKEVWVEAEIGSSVATDIHSGYQFHYDWLEVIDQGHVTSCHVCTCDIKALWDRGCSCGGFAAEQTAKGPKSASTGTSYEAWDPRVFSPAPTQADGEWPF